MPPPPRRPLRLGPAHAPGRRPGDRRDGRLLYGHRPGLGRALPLDLEDGGLHARAPPPRPDRPLRPRRRGRRRAGGGRPHRRLPPRPPMTRRSLFPLAVAASLLVGCDSSGPDVVDLDDVLLVDLVEGGAVVRLETEGDAGLLRAHRLRNARDAGRPAGPDTTGLAVEGGARVPRDHEPRRSAWRSRRSRPSGSALEIEHRGETGRLRRPSGGSGGLFLDPVRQSVTRLRGV